MQSVLRAVGLAVFGVCAVGTGTFAAPSSFVDLGTVGSPGSYRFDTSGSSTTTQPAVDTEMAIYNDLGELLAENDDVGGGVLTSEITLNLDAGVYYVGVSRFNSVWEPNFINSRSPFADGDLADFDLNINDVLAAEAVLGLDTLNGIDNQTQFWQIVVIPEPASVALLSAGGWALLRRRRRRQSIALEPN